MLKYLALTVVSAALLSGCQRETGPDPLKLTGKMFVFNYRLGYATYMVTLSKKEQVPEGTRVIAQFENPAGGEPLTLTRELFPKLEKVVLESPDVICIKKGRPYAVTIAVTSPQGEVLQKLETNVVSDLDQDIMPAKALVDGPGYEMNPEVFKGGKAPARFETAVCAVS
ncbi:hypothetical protein [Ensifer sp. Root127]|uniref:hypothetical protein n=1 Tax=Ensifer sp. Root127 TaxID=1736440 RepID=UPI00070900AF|nr:hypothetical protein [Ensifer sp. Root127]KQW72461.1 hypothetical protein ASD03_32465 [Ensifer sp. Root127]